MGFVGVARDETTHRPTPYRRRCPTTSAPSRCWVLDPMLATGGSMVYTIELLHDRGARDITAVCGCAPEGIAALEKAAPEARLFTATVDDGLNEGRLHRARPRRRR